MNGFEVLKAISPKVQRPLTIFITGWLSRQKRLSETQRVQLVHLSSAAYFLLFGLTIWEAMRGVPLLAPDALTLLAFSLALSVSALAATIIALPELRLAAISWAKTLEVCL